MFRMLYSCFNELCCCIENRVGRESFCSQDFISTELEQGNSKLARIYMAHKETSGGFVCGEVKLAITLRILVGGSYLDIACIFHVHPGQVYPIFHKVLLEWICHDSIARYTLRDIIQDEDEMFKVSSQFAEGRTGGILAGVIGALDGWLVKIECPSLKKDGVENPGGYFSHKGFYALNVQAIVDKRKRILWMYLRAKGGEHDSAAFKSSNLYETLENIFLDRNGKMHSTNSMNIPFYIIGDSATIHSVQFFWCHLIMLCLSCQRIHLTTVCLLQGLMWNVRLGKLMPNEVYSGNHSNSTWKNKRIQLMLHFVCIILFWITKIDIVLRMMMTWNCFLSNVSHF
jgi:hypothetical protein